MKLSKLIKKLLKCKNQDYYDCMKKYGIHGGNFLYKIALRMQEDTKYVQILLPLKDDDWNEIYIPGDMDVTLYEHKVNTIDEFYSNEPDRYKWLYLLWLNKKEIEFDLENVDCPIFIIGSKSQDIRSLSYEEAMEKSMRTLE